jgi:hypothetical protein
MRCRIDGKEMPHAGMRDCQRRRVAVDSSLKVRYVVVVKWWKRCRSPREIPPLSGMGGMSHWIPVEVVWAGGSFACGEGEATCWYLDCRN